MKKYFDLLRVKHYLKNILIFLPLFFSGNFLNWSGYTLKSVIGFFIFCILASGIYLFNDLIDLEQDRQHPTKKNRPIASGAVSKGKAIGIMLFLFALVISAQFLLFQFKIYGESELINSSIALLAYFVINILYSKYLKNVPIVDVIILASCFVIRVFYGGVVISVEISGWLYLTILSMSLYLALGKRRGELRRSDKTSRKVLAYYSENFLDKFMYVFLNSAIVFYSLWCIMGLTNLNKSMYTLMISIIFVIFIVMRYSLDIEKDNLADPVEVIYSDKVLFISVIFYAIYMGVIMYI